MFGRGIGQSIHVANGLPIATKYALLYYNYVSLAICSGEQLMSVTQPAIRNKYAWKSDKPPSLFATTHDAIQQHTIRINYQVAMWVQSYEA